MEGSGDRKRVAIIGAGASGLTAIKCVREEGLVPVCFERSDDIGGLWNYSPSTKEDGQASCTKSTIINTSKERMCFSDFPIPEEYPNFMHNTKVLEYFRMYAKEFNLLSHIKFNTEILRVEQTEDFEKTGRYGPSPHKALLIDAKLVNGLALVETSQGRTQGNHPHRVGKRRHWVYPHVKST